MRGAPLHQRAGFGLAAGDVHRRAVVDRAKRRGRAFRERAVEVDAAGVIPHVGGQAIGVGQRDKPDLFAVHQARHARIDAVVVQEAIDQVEAHFHAEVLVPVERGDIGELGLIFLEVGVVGDSNRPQFAPLGGLADRNHARDRGMSGDQGGQVIRQRGIRVIEAEGIGAYGRGERLGLRRGLWCGRPACSRIRQSQRRRPAVARGRDLNWPVSGCDRHIVDVLRGDRHGDRLSGVRR